MNGSSKNKTYLAISTFANNLIQNPQVRIPPEVLKEMLITEPDVNSFITIAQSKIYERHKVNEEEITQAVDYYKSVDVEIANISEEIANNLELAYVGQFEIDNTPLPQMLTPDLAMRTLIEIYEAGKYFTYKHFTLLKRKNIPFNQSSPEFVEAMRRLKIEEDFAKDQIFARVGLDKFEENPMVRSIELDRFILGNR